MSDKEIIGLAALIALRRRVDSVANNVANLTTPAFKAGRVQFKEYLTEAEEADGPAMAKRSLVSTSHFTDFSVGGMRATGNPLDVALTEDDAFFVVDTPGGPRYTRSGAFTLNADGKLTTIDGKPVLTSIGHLVVQPRDGPVTIAGDGSISTLRGRIAGLRLVRFVDRRELKPEGGGLYSSAHSPLVVPSGAGRLAIGVLETSNVREADEMSRLIAASNAYETLAKVVFKSESPDELRKLAGED